MFKWDTPNLCQTRKAGYVGYTMLMCFKNKKVNEIK